MRGFLRLALSPANPNRSHLVRLRASPYHWLWPIRRSSEPRPFVNDARGATVVPPGDGWICIAVLLRFVLAPGQQFQRTFVWETSPFAAGNYSIYATFSAEEVSLRTPAEVVQLK